MATSEEFTEYILESLSPLDNLRTTRMFGGVLLEVEDSQLGILIDDVVYFKITNPEIQDRYKKLGSKQFSYTRKDKDGPVVIKNWWSVPDSAMDNEDELVLLAEEALGQSNIVKK